MLNTVSLKKNKEFKKIFLKGKWYAGKCIILYLLPNKLNYNRLGIAVSKKVGNSVKRNRIKRILREIFRLNENIIKIGYDFIILWKNKEKEINFHYTHIDFLKLLEKSGLIETGDIKNK